MYILARTVLMWLLFIPVPIINGLLREKYYKTKLGHKLSHQVGVVVLSVMFCLYGYIFFGRIIDQLTTGQIYTAGVIWVVLTMLFEFTLGLKNKLSWSQMLEQYNLLRGNLWPVFLIVEFFSLVLIKAWK